jgi:glycerophosphoryl diester phosphodiesterase
LSGWRAAAVAFAVAATPAWGLDIEGHRGARGRFPENTLPAFAAALSIGVTTLEFDTGVTRDGVVVISHNRRLDPDITRGPDGAWLVSPGPAIRALTLAELKRYDVGAIRPGSDYAKSFGAQRAVPGTPIPTLHELAELVRRSGNDAVRFNLETKLSPLAPDEAPDPETFAAATVAAVRAEGIVGRTMIQSFDWRTLVLVQRLAPELPTVYLTIERGAGDNIWRSRAERSPWLAGFDPKDQAGSVPRAVQSAGGRLWSPFYRDVTDAALAEAKALGLETVVWTVNDETEMRQLIARGVDGIISDYPDRLRAVAASLGLPLPKATPVAPP